MIGVVEQHIAFANGVEAVAEFIKPQMTQARHRFVLELLRQASFDPSVLAIKINIYRVAKDSRIIDAMR
jgi:polyphosphate kinase